MKTFKAENKVNIEAELIDINGNKMVVRGRYISLKDQERINKIIKDEKLDYVQKLIQSMIIYFGGKAEDYKDFDARLLSEVIKYYGEEYTAQNPTQVGSDSTKSGTPST